MSTLGKSWKWRRNENGQSVGKSSIVCVRCGKKFRSYYNSKGKLPSFCGNRCKTTTNRSSGNCRHKKGTRCKKCSYIVFKRHNLKRYFGITFTQWEALFELQGGKCPICLVDLKKINTSTNAETAFVDHDHESGRVRGLVCNVCNRSKIGSNTTATAKRLVEFLSSTTDGRNL